MQEQEQTAGQMVHPLAFDDGRPVLLDAAGNVVAGPFETMREAEDAMDSADAGSK